MAIVRPTIYDWAFAQRKQSDIFTAIAAGSLNKKLPFREFTVSTKEKFIHSDRLYFGKGHDFASRVDQVGEQFHFGRTFDATSEALSWALSLLMGGVVTTGPTTLYYTHVLSWSDPNVQKECLYTTIIERAASEYQKLISGVFVESVVLTATGRENIMIAVVCSGRKQVDNVTVLPSVTPSVVMRSNHATFTFGATGAQTGISESVIGWTLNLGQNPDIRWVPGQSSGEEKNLRYALVGPQTISGSIQFFMTATLRELFLNHDRVGITIHNYGVANVNHKFDIEIPVFYVSQEAIEQSGQTTALTLSWNEDVTVKDDTVAGAPLKITLVNEIPALLV